MSKRKGRHPKQPGGRTTPKGTRPPASHRNFADHGEPELVREVRQVIAAGLAPTLEAASAMVEAGTARPLDKLTHQSNDRTDLGELLASFVDSPFQPMHVLARVMVPMLDDRLLARRIANHLDAGRFRSPVHWLESIETPSVAGVVAMTDPFGDGDNVILGIEWPTGDAVTAVIYIDHNLGTLVKDAFTVPDTLDATVRHFRDIADGEPTTFVDLAPADARAKIADAIAQSERTLPPVETDSWPMIRPLVEWWIGLLPEGGSGYEIEEWSHEELDALADRFAASLFATGLRARADAVRSMVEPMLWFACGFTPGDPLRWSPVSVEIALTDWIPRKVLIGRDELRHVPEVMSALVRFAHAERGLDASLTNDVLQSVTRWTPDFIDAIAGHDDLWDDDDDDLDDGFPTVVDMLDMVDQWEDRLIDEIGGPEALASLDDEPLPDEPFEWAGIADGIGDLVAEVLTRVDAACDELLDAEMRTICRRYLAAAVRADAKMFERSTRTDLVAGGIVWAAISIQNARQLEVGGLPTPTQKQLAAAMEVNPGSVSQRAGSLRNTLEQRTDVVQAGPWHSARRRAWLNQLDRTAVYRRELSARLEAVDEP